MGRLPAAYAVSFQAPHPELGKLVDVHAVLTGLDSADPSMQARHDVIAATMPELWPTMTPTSEFTVRALRKPQIKMAMRQSRIDGSVKPLESGAVLLTQNAAF